MEFDTLPGCVRGPESDDSATLLNFCSWLCVIQFSVRGNRLQHLFSMTGKISRFPSACTLWCYLIKFCRFVKIWSEIVWARVTESPLKFPNKSCKPNSKYLRSDGSRSTTRSTSNECREIRSQSFMIVVISPIPRRCVPVRRFKYRKIPNTDYKNTEKYNVESTNYQSEHRGNDVLALGTP